MTEGRGGRYRISDDDIESIIIPSLGSFLFIPPPAATGFGGMEFIHSYMRLLSSDEYRDHAEAKDRLIGHCDAMAVMNVIRSLKRHYEWLMTAKIEGGTLATLSETRRHCRSCSTRVGEVIEIDYLLAKFQSGRPEFPHEIYVEESAAFCEGLYYRFNMLLRPGDDPNFTNVWKGISDE